MMLSHQTALIQMCGTYLNDKPSSTKTACITPPQLGFNGQLLFFSSHVEQAGKTRTDYIKR